MKKLTTLILLLLSPLVMAQEKQVWACQMEAGSQLSWRDGGWNLRGVSPRTILFTINTDNTAKAKESGVDSELYLKCVKSSWLSCLGDSDSTHYLFDSETGKLGVSYLLGAVSTSENNRDSIASVSFNCTKF